MIAPWAKKYVGVPFEPGGRDRSGCDCYGLVYLVYLEEFGVQLPGYTGAYTAETPAAHVAALVKDGADAAWAPVKAPGDAAPADVVLIRRLGHESHVGLYVGDHKMLHCDRGVGAVIEDLRTGKWDVKIAGYYRFAGARGPKRPEAENVLVTAKTSPFVSHCALISYAPGMTIEEIVEEAEIPDYYRTGVAVRLDGGDIPPAWWPRIRPKAGHHVEIVVVPCGPLAEQLGISTMTLRLGTMAGVSVAAGLVSAAIGGPAGWAVGAALGIVGMLAVNALIPPPKLPAEDTGYSLGGGGSTLRPFDPIPLLFGTHRVFPPLAAMPYTEAAGRDQYLHLLYLVGLGQMELSALKLGDEPLENYSDVEVEILRGVPADDPPLTLYEGDVQEQTINAKLEQKLENVWNLREGTGEGEYSAAKLGWQTRTSSTNPDRLSIDLAFYRGLIELHDGDPKEASVDFDIQARELPFGEWLAFNPFLLASDFLEAAKAFTLALGYSWMRVLEGGFERVSSHIAGMSTANRKAPAAVLARIDHRLGKLSARIEALEKHATGGNLTTLQTLQADVDAVRAKYAAWTTTTEEATVTAAKNAINLTMDFYEGAYALLETIWNDSKGGAAYRAHSPWWRRWCLARWYRQSIIDLFSQRSIRRTGPQRWHTVTDKYNGIVRVSGWWAVESDSSITGGATRYEVRLRRRSQQIEDESRTIYDEASWAAFRTHRIGEAVTRDDIALVALRIKASDQLNGMVSNFNLIAKALTPYYNGATPVPAYSAWPAKVSSNPAWAYLRVLCDPKINARAVPVGRLDFERFKEWAAACEAASPPRTFDAYVTRDLTVFRLLGQIATTGRAVFGMRDGKFSIVQDRKQTTPIQHFTPRNSWDFMASRSLVEKPHALRCTFLNARADYEQDEIFVYNDGYNAENATFFEDMEFYGVTDADAVHREARYHLAVAELRPEVIEFATDIEHLVCNVGDLVLVTHDVPLWGLTAGRVKAVNGASITVDEPVPMVAGTNYGIRFRLQDGSSMLRTVTTNPGRQSTVVLNSAVAGLKAGDLFMFGEAGRETRELIIKEIRPRGENDAEIRCVDHAPAVHTSDTEEIPPYDPGVTRPPVIGLVGPPAPLIESVICDERALERDVYGTLRTRIIIELRPPSRYAGPPPQYLEVEYRRSGARDWLRLPVQRTDVGSVVISDVQVGQCYDIRVRYTEGGLASAWVTLWGVYVTGRLALPAVPAAPLPELWLEGGRILRWNLPYLPADFAGFEIRYAYGASVTWETANHLHEGLLTGQSYTLPEGLRGVLTFEIRAVDTAGKYGAHGAKLIMGLGDRIPENVVLQIQFLYQSQWAYCHKENMAVWVRSNLLATTGFAPPMYDNDAAAMYTADKTEPFYNCIFPRASVVYPIESVYGVPGTVLTVDTVAGGDSWRTEYRPYYGLWPRFLTKDLWPADLAENLWPAKAPLGQWRPFHGELTLNASDMDYLEQKGFEFRVVFEAGRSQGWIEGWDYSFDVPDVEEALEDVEIAVGGSRLPITKKYRDIRAVQIAIQNIHDDVATVRIVDKNPTMGPLVKCLNASGNSVVGVIDAVVKGY